MMIDPEEFVETARHILATIETAFAEHGVALPERRYLSVGGQGTTVHDCEQVTVTFEQGYSGKPGNQAQEPVKCNEGRTAVFVVEVVRAVPTVNTAEATPQTTVPSRYGQVVSGVDTIDPEKLTEVAERQMRDAVILLDAGIRAGQTAMQGAISDVSAGTPQGGLQAMILSITTSAQGF
jgi:hypothetical protein